MSSISGTHRRRRVLLTIAGGGFFWQSKAVAVALSDCCELHYLTPEPPSAWAGRGLPPGQFHEVFRITTQGERGLWRRLRNFFRSARDTYRVIRQVRPDTVICVASSLAVPLCAWARLLRTKSVFIESITRVSHPSTTGRILDALRLCDQFYVQWPSAARLYTRAMYKGNLL